MFESRSSLDETARALKELRDEIRQMREALEGRVGALELARAEDVGERKGRAGVGRIVVAAAAVGGAVSGAIWALIDHL